MPKESELKERLVEQLKAEVNARFGKNAALRGVARSLVAMKKARDSDDPDASKRLVESVFAIFEEESIQEEQRRRENG